MRDTKPFLTLGKMVRISKWLFTSNVTYLTIVASVKREEKGLVNQPTSVTNAALEMIWPF